jgi:hypothetical protein
LLAVAGLDCRVAEVGQDELLAERQVGVQRAGPQLLLGEPRQGLVCG